MSAHELTPHSGAPEHRIVRVGWDAALSTFFAQVLDEDDDEILDVVWLGTDPLEISDPGTVIDAVRPYANVPDNLAKALADEAAAEGNRFAGRPGSQIVAETTLARGVSPERAAAIFSELDGS
ncbi:hypothetical protein AB0G73_23985 [Streptomyces sp. NPDC020719]|uniref:hypothetical protein n=1 Tax=Streptomyces sp. NPDC020719 TaxID=3154896 RepID=UPI0033FFF9BC